MERTVPSTASEEIELFLRTLYSLLRSTTEIQIRTLEEVHSGMNSLLHPDARKNSPDMSAFLYSIQRLPPSIVHVKRVILGQNSEGFTRRGWANIETWEQDCAAARRRRCYYNGKDTLACFIASRTDIEDMVPTLTAFQIEWNKIHNLLVSAPKDLDLSRVLESPAATNRLAEVLQILPEDLGRLQTIWGKAFLENLQLIRARTCSFHLLLIGGSHIDYWRATRSWWENIERAFPAVLTRPVYFISSNIHSLPNMLAGFALQHKETLIQFVTGGSRPHLKAMWDELQSGESGASPENFFYFALREYEDTPAGKDLAEQHQAYERELGIVRVSSEHSFDVEAQIFDLSRLKPELMDPRLAVSLLGGTNMDYSYLKNSDALLINIDYPLGLAAYNILAKIAEHANPILGVYVLGKAATLNGVRGDVMIPNVVQDEHSQNTYLFQNAFTAQDVAPYLMFGTVLDNQKAVSVFGTFLQNARIMDVFYREGYTDIEMESGPFLSSMYEMYRPKRHPTNEIVNLYNVPFDVGILHYASDTPLSKGKNLGAGSLSYFGMDSTYACSIAVLRRIFDNERKRLSK